MDQVIEFLFMINIAYLEFVQGFFPTLAYDEIYFYTLAVVAIVTWVLYVAKCLTSYSRKDLEALEDEILDRGEEAVMQLRSEHKKAINSLTRDLVSFKDKAASAVAESKRKTQLLAERDAYIADQSREKEELEEIVAKLRTSKGSENCYEVERMIVALIRENDDFEELERKAKNLVEAMK